MDGDLSAYIQFISPPRSHRFSELQYPRLNSPGQHNGSGGSGYHLDDSDFCQPSNVDQCIEYLDKELQVLGFGSLFNQTGEFQQPSLINATHNLLRKYQRSNRYREDLESKTQRCSAELEQVQTVVKRLKGSNETLQRKLSKADEAKRQVKAENSELKSNFKSLAEELKRAKSQVQTNESQYRHELKKKERQFTALKEKTQQLLAEKKSSHAASLELSRCLTRADGKRSMWKNEAANVRHEDDLTRTILASYDQRCTSLQAENRNLREILSDVLGELNGLKRSSPTKSPKKGSLTSDHLQLPIDQIHAQIYASIRECCGHINQVLAPPSNGLDVTFTIESSEQAASSTPRQERSAQTTSSGKRDRGVQHLSASGSSATADSEQHCDRSPGKSRISEHREQVKLAVEKDAASKGDSFSQQ